MTLKDTMNTLEESLDGFMGNRAKLAALLKGKTKAQQLALLEKARRYGRRQKNGKGYWGFRFGKGNRGLVGKGNQIRVDFRKRCVIGWKPLAAVFGFESWESFRTVIKRSEPPIRLPKWSGSIDSEGTDKSQVYIPKALVLVLLFRIYWGNQKMSASKRFELALHAVSFTQDANVAALDLTGV